MNDAIERLTDGTLVFCRSGSTEIRRYCVV